MADNPIDIGVEWERVPGNQSLSGKQVRCEDVQNPALSGTIDHKKAPPKRRDCIPGG